MRYSAPQPTAKHKANASKHKSKLKQQNVRTARLMVAEKKTSQSRQQKAGYDDL